MLEDSMQIIMDEGWFDMASLVAVARCNKQLCRSWIVLIICGNQSWLTSTFLREESLTMLIG
jgi:hypothetical protein